jgi:hypothetical protein
MKSQGISNPLQTFILISLGFVILYLVYRNVGVITQIIKFASDAFGASFNAVTSVGTFGAQKVTGTKTP